MSHPTADPNSAADISSRSFPQYFPQTHVSHLPWKGPQQPLPTISLHYQKANPHFPSALVPASVTWSAPKCPSKTVEEPCRGCLKVDLTVLLVLKVLGHRRWVPSDYRSHHALTKPNIVFSSHLNSQFPGTAAVISVHAHRDLNVVRMVRGKVLMPIQQ